MIRFIFLLFPFFLTAESFRNDFKFNCVVSDQIILGIDEGKSSRYSSYEGGLQNQDKFSLDVALIGEDTGPGFDSVRSISIVAEYGGIAIDQFIVSAYGFNDLGTVQTLSRPDGKMTLSNAHTILISKSGFMGEVFIKRYYKDDYSFMYTSRIGGEGFTLTANCMNNKQMTEAIDGMFEYAQIAAKFREQ